MRQPGENGDLSQICTRTLISRIRVERERLDGGQQTCQVASPSNRQASASASSVYVSPSTVHLPLSFHACVTIFWAGLLWKLHSVCGQWIKITQHTGNYSLGHPVICFSDGIAGRATVPPSGQTKPGFAYSPTIILTMIRHIFWLIFI